MAQVWTWTLGSVLVVSLVSLVGIVFVSIGQRWLNRALFLLVSLAAGGLLGDAFIHLLPETFGNGEDSVSPSLSVIAGILAFFLLEKLLRWKHHHLNVAERSVEPVGYTNLVADGLHNLIDGMIIGASYLVSIPVGLATTTAVVLHEIPQEISDFGVLLHAGFSRKQALLFNFFTASLAILGALVILRVDGDLEHLTTFMVPFTAGSFIYIAGSDLLPELHKEVAPWRSFLQIVAMSAGVGLMLILKTLE